MKATQHQRYMIELAIGKALRSAERREVMSIVTAALPNWLHTTINSTASYPVSQRANVPAFVQFAGVCHTAPLRLRHRPGCFNESQQIEANILNWAVASHFWKTLRRGIQVHGEEQIKDDWRRQFKLLLPGIYISKHCCIDLRLAGAKQQREQCSKRWTLKPVNALKTCNCGLYVFYWNSAIEWCTMSKLIVWSTRNGQRHHYIHVTQNMQTCTCSLQGEQWC